MFSLPPTCIPHRGKPLLFYLNFVLSQLHLNRKTYALDYVFLYPNHIQRRISNLSHPLSPISQFPPSIPPTTSIILKVYNRLSRYLVCLTRQLSLTDNCISPCLVYFTVAFGY